MTRATPARCSGSSKEIVSKESKGQGAVQKQEYSDENRTISVHPGQAFLGDNRSSSGLGLGDGLVSHTSKWLQAGCVTCTWLQQGLREDAASCSNATRCPHCCAAVLHARARMPLCAAAAGGQDRTHVCTAQQPRHGAQAARRSEWMPPISMHAHQVEDVRGHVWADTTGGRLCVRQHQVADGVHPRRAAHQGPWRGGCLFWRCAPSLPCILPEPMPWLNCAPRRDLAHAAGLLRMSQGAVWSVHQEVITCSRACFERCMMLTQRMTQRWVHQWSTLT